MARTIESTIQVGAWLKELVLSVVITIFYLSV
jgi:hypothetical protein